VPIGDSEVNSDQRHILKGSLQDHRHNLGILGLTSARAAATTIADVFPPGLLAEPPELVVFFTCNRLRVLLQSDYTPETDRHARYTVLNPLSGSFVALPSRSCAAVRGAARDTPRPTSAEDWDWECDAPCVTAAGGHASHRCYPGPPTVAGLEG
jgi:hypothetical protein